MEASPPPTSAVPTGTLLACLGAAGPGLLAQFDTALGLPTAIVGLVSAAMMLAGIVLGNQAIRTCRGKKAANPFRQSYRYDTTFQLAHH